MSIFNITQYINIIYAKYTNVKLYFKEFFVENRKFSLNFLDKAFWRH